MRAQVTSTMHIYELMRVLCVQQDAGSDAGREDGARQQREREERLTEAEQRTWMMSKISKKR